MKKWQRVKFGDEKKKVAFTRCPTCEAKEGEYHVNRCGEEECVECGGKWIECCGFRGCRRA